MGNMEFQNTSVACNESQKTAGDSSCKKKTAPSELLDVEPLKLHFSFGLGNKLMPCSLMLTNKSDESVAYRLTEKSGNYKDFLRLPWCGVVLPRSAYTLVLFATQDQDEPLQERYFDVILQNSVLEYQNICPFQEDSEYDVFFSEAEEAGKAVHEVTIRAVYGDQRGKATSEGTTKGIKIQFAEEYPENQTLLSLDVNQTDPLIVTGDDNGHVRILHSDTQVPVAIMEDQMENEATCVKFMARRNWILAGSEDDSIYVYNYANKMQKIERIDVCMDWMTSLAVHPSLPLVLACGNRIKLWRWDKQWECIKEFDDEHSVLVCQVVFNPVDTNNFASASCDHTVKVWNLDTPSSVCTLEGHSNDINCLDYFTCDSKQYLITGSDDKTAKIWDMEMKMCIQTLDAFADAVTSVCSHPSLPLLITGSCDGLVQFWSSTTFRLQNVLNFGFGGQVVGFGCFKDSRRIVIGHRNILSVIELDEESIASEYNTKSTNKRQKKDPDCSVHSDYTPGWKRVTGDIDASP